ncbi:jhy protein homolog isoform X2 [Tachyglossus aculeatus]|uniref:jhy protein homolog isoform X2 n=1 Tax=Tachyglossus aculeatus TaxID=9261 RepID=UPI0018F5B3D1|nr:jhy protein homolog isoform X2 [Tachyglossus aculeatus]
MSNTKLIPRLPNRPPVHHSNLKTPPESPSFKMGDFHQNLQGFVESDSESLKQGRRHQIDFQKRNLDDEDLLRETFEELDRDSLEKSSPEGKSWSDSEESETESFKPHELSSRRDLSPEGSDEKGSHQLPVDKYSDLRYNPNWKNNQEDQKSSATKKLHQAVEIVPQNISEDSLQSSSEASFEQLKEKGKEGQSPRSSITLLGSEFLSPGYEHNGVTSEAFSMQSSSDREEKMDQVAQYLKSSGVEVGGFQPKSWAPQKWRSKQDFVEKNKLTLGLSTQKSDSYLKLHNRKLREVHQEQEYRDQLSQSERIKSSQMPNDLLLQATDGQIVTRKFHKHKCLSGPKSQKTPKKPSSSGNFSLDQVDQSSVLGWPQSYPLVKPDDPSIKLGSGVSQNMPVGDLASSNPDVSQNHWGISNDFALPKQPLISYRNSPGFSLSPFHGNDEREGYSHFQKLRSRHQQPHFTPPPELGSPSVSGSNREQWAPSQKMSLPASNANAQGPFEKKPSPQGLLKQTYSEATYQDPPISRLPESSSHSQLGRASPETRLNHLMEQHQHALTQLTDLQPQESSSIMFPPVLSKAESESHLSSGRSERSQATISHSNSKSYLFNLKRHKKLQVRGSKKLSKLKGYQKKDVMLGGLGPDFESIKDKTEKLKQQKEYAKQVKEHNMRILSTMSKPQNAKQESKSAVSRQKALEYAKNIPKPKPVLPSNLTDPESKEGQILTYAGKEESLPEITLLEVLQSRHEREKQAVAAFKVLHIV